MKKQTQPDKARLLPCPFCGALPHERARTQMRQLDYMIIHNADCCLGNQHWICGDVQVAAWNNRKLVINPSEHAALVALEEAAQLYADDRNPNFDAKEFSEKYNCFPSSFEAQDLIANSMRIALANLAAARGESEGGK